MMPLKKPSKGMLLKISQYAMGDDGEEISSKY